MMRCKELEEYIQEYCSERRKIKWEYLDKHYSMLFPAFVENLDILIVGDFVEWNGNEFVAINNI